MKNYSLINIYKSLNCFTIILLKKCFLQKVNKIREIFYQQKFPIITVQSTRTPQLLWLLGMLIIRERKNSLKIINYNGMRLLQRGTLYINYSVGRDNPPNKRPHLQRTFTSYRSTQEAPPLSQESLRRRITLRSQTGSGSSRSASRRSELRPSALQLIDAIASRVRARTGEQGALARLCRRLAAAIQMGNAACIVEAHTPFLP